MADGLHDLLVGVNAFLVWLVAVAAANGRSWRRLGSSPGGRSGPRVSILVPARDEAHQIGDCVRSLLAQDYADFDVVALDDDSTDGTGRILRGLAAADARLRVLSGRPLPPGWLGKNWACHQLADAATGELLLFTDADTRHDPRALGEAVAALRDADVALLSALPRQDVRSWGERLLVPILPWSLYSCYPEPLIRRLRRPALAVAVGQHMLFRRAAYRRVGGHEAVRAIATEDVALAGRLVAAGERVCLADGCARVTCRMYTGFSSAWAGFGRSLLPALGGRAWVFALIWAWLGLVFLLPPVLVLAWLLGAGPAPALALSAVGLALASWALVIRRFGLPRRLLPAYPAIMALSVAAAGYSLVLGLTGRATWKGRPVSAAR